MSARLTIGLTGGIGSGKSSVAREFEALGVEVIDADALAHGLTAPGGGAIEANLKDSIDAVARRVGRGAGLRETVQQHGLTQVGQG